MFNELCCSSNFSVSTQTKRQTETESGLPSEASARFGGSRQMENGMRRRKDKRQF